MSDSNKAGVTIARAGEFFMCCLWLQGQMVDLLIFSKHPELLPDFLSHPTKIPPALVEQRAEYWKEDFVKVKQKFEVQFRDQMTAQHIEDLKVIFHLRNVIGHSHVSIGRDYLLYRPSNANKEQEIISTFGLQPRKDQASPTMMTLRLNDDARYMYDFNRIKRLDEECFSAIADSLGVPHGRIR